MSRRHEGRILALQFLFQRDFNTDDLEAALADFWALHSVRPRLREFAESLIRGVEQMRPSLDERLRQFLVNWELSRLAAVDRNILRLALYEMLHRPDIPPVVSLNEAIDLAKEFGDPDSPRFVNGVLDRAVQTLQRPAREPATGRSVRGSTQSRKG